MSSLFQSVSIQGTAGDGPRLLITAGVHGDEYEGMEAIRKLVVFIDHSQLRGQLTLVPVVNESAFARKSRVGEDSLDLARRCPGKEDGSLTEQIAHQLSLLIRQSDYYIDLHSGGNVMQVDPLVGYQLVSDPSVLDSQRSMAKAFGLPIVWGASAELEGRTLTVARDAKVPAIYAEYLGGGGCSAKGVQAYFEGCLNVMAEVGMLDPRPAPPAPEAVTEDPRPNSGHMQICHPSPADGYFEPVVGLGQSVEPGQILGTIVETLGRSSIAVYADKSGRVIVLRKCPAVKAGDSLAVILETELIKNWIP